eukprot:293638-Pelagomonas_calceolata.AAC.1
MEIAVSRMQSTQRMSEYDKSAQKGSKWGRMFVGTFGLAGALASWGESVSSSSEEKTRASCLGVLGWVRGGLEDSIHDMAEELHLAWALDGFDQLCCRPDEAFKGWPRDGVSAPPGQALLELRFDGLGVELVRGHSFGSPHKGDGHGCGAADGGFANSGSGGSLGSHSMAVGFCCLDGCGEGERL